MSNPNGDNPCTFIVSSLTLHLQFSRMARSPSEAPQVALQRDNAEDHCLSERAGVSVVTGSALRCHALIFKGRSFTLIQMKSEGDNLVPCQAEQEDIEAECLLLEYSRAVTPVHRFHMRSYPILYLLGQNTQTLDSFFLSEKK